MSPSPPPYSPPLPPPPPASSSSSSFLSLSFISRGSPSWLPDRACQRCPACLEDFSVFRRKHHCRLDGLIYCAACSSYTLFDRRVCGACFRAFQLRKQIINKNKYKKKQNIQVDEEADAAVASGPEVLSHVVSPSPRVSLLAGPLAQVLENAARQPVRIGTHDNRKRGKTGDNEGHSVHARANNWNMLAIQAKLHSIERQHSSGLSLFFLAFLMSLALTALLLAIVPSQALPVYQSFLLGQHTNIATVPHAIYSSLLSFFHWLAALAAAAPTLAAALADAPTWIWEHLTWDNARTIVFHHDYASLVVRVRSLALAVERIAVAFYSLVTPRVVMAVQYAVEHYTLIIVIAIAFYCLLLFVFGWRLIPRAFRISYVSLIFLLSYERLKYRDRWEKFWYKEKSQTQLAEESLQRWTATHTRLADLVCHHILELRGFWIKVGQYLSSRADLVPQEYINKLKELQDDVKQSPFEHVERVIVEEFGAKVDDLFLSFNRVPLASASIAQVHEAILKDSTHVVVKVRHPGVERVLPADFSHLMLIMRVVAWFDPDYDLRPVISEWAGEVEKELHFTREAANMERIRLTLLNLGLDVIVPRCVRHLVRERVLVMEFIDGFRITDRERLDEYGVDRLALMSRVAQAVSAQIYYDGFFSCDIHAGNLLVQIRDGRAIPVLLDFGLCKALAPRIRHAFALLVTSVAEVDYAGLMSAFDEMGLRLKNADPVEDMRWLQFALRDTAPSEAARAENQRFAASEEKRKKIAKRPRNPIESWPTELIFYMRASSLLRGLCSTLGVKLPFLSVLSQYAKLTLINSIPPSLHASSVIFPSPVLSPLDSKLRSLITRLFADGHLLGCQVAVYHRGRRMADIAAGVRGRVDPRPVEHNTLFNAFAVTSPVVATLLHMLIDNRLVYSPLKPRQSVGYERRVAHFWPEFAVHGKERITVGELMSHQAGLENALSAHTTINELCDFDGMCARVAAAKPSSKPHCQAAYHDLSYGFLVGGLVTRVTGRSIPDLLSDAIATPLGFANELFIGLPLREHERAAQIANGFGKHGGPPGADEIKEMRKLARKINPTTEWNDDADDEQFHAASLGLGELPSPLMFNLPSLRSACIPSANGHFTARALAKFYAALANDGFIDGARLLSPGLAAPLFTTIESRLSVDRGAAANWAKGARVYEMKDQTTAFGHSGLGGSFSLCHPASQTSIVVLVSQLTSAQRAAALITRMALNAVGVEISQGENAFPTDRQIGTVGENM